MAIRASQICTNKRNPAKQERDAAICSAYRDGRSLASIAASVGITKQQCQAICAQNKELIATDAAWEKLTRINHLKRLLAKHPDSLQRKGTLDILEQLRREIEGDKPQLELHQTMLMPSITLAGKQVDFNVGEKIPVAIKSTSPNE